MFFSNVFKREKVIPVKSILLLSPPERMEEAKRAMEILEKLKGEKVSIYLEEINLCNDPMDNQGLLFSIEHAYRVLLFLPTMSAITEIGLKISFLIGYKIRSIEGNGEYRSMFLCTCNKPAYTEFYRQPTGTIHCSTSLALKCTLSDINSGLNCEKFSTWGPLFNSFLKEKGFEPVSD